jgi:hypothetical protein
LFLLRSPTALFIGANAYPCQLCGDVLYSLVAAREHHMEWHALVPMPDKLALSPQLCYMTWLQYTGPEPPYKKPPPPPILTLGLLPDQVPSSGWSIAGWQKPCPTT